MAISRQKSEAIEMLASHLGVLPWRFNRVKSPTLVKALAVLFSLTPIERVFSARQARRERQIALERLILATRAEAKLAASATDRDCMRAVLGADVLEKLEERLACVGIRIAKHNRRKFRGRSEGPTCH